MEVIFIGDFLCFLSSQVVVIYMINGYIVFYVFSFVYKKYIIVLINIFLDKGRGYLLNFFGRYIFESCIIVLVNIGLYIDVKFVVFIF